MSIDTTHPDLEREQSYVDRAYACMERMLADVQALTPQGRNDYERDVFEHWQRTRIGALSDTVSALVFGRIDERDGDTHYIGRHHVRDDGYDAVVVDWRAPVAKAFYQAGPADPMGLLLRRQFLVEGREILGITDDDLASQRAGDAADDGSGLRAVDVLEHELSRRRTGTMRDVVATIQAEQDAIIRSPLSGVVVVQGGPGTGKTVVGLHRAAYLLYEHRRRLERLGVLIVGPNPVFIRYISQVLPALGESAVTQVPVAGLAPWARIVADEPPEVERLKGDVRMAEVVRRALDQRRGTLEEDVALVVRSDRFVVPATLVASEVQKLVARGTPWRRGREMLRDALLVHAHAAYERALPADAVPAAYDEVVSTVRNDPAFRRALDVVWPSVSEQKLVGDLFASPSRLRAAAGDSLTVDERRMLRRRRERGKDAWTAADRPLLDEARALIEGAPDRYGHVVADEAQDLSPMQLRMLARRCPQGSFTVLGDLGQATGVWAHDDWSQVTAHLPAGERRVTELSIGYRVGGSIMDVASRVLAHVAPGIRPPRAVRRERGDVRWVDADEGSRAAAAAGEARRLLEQVGAVAVIAPSDLVDEVRRALRTADVSFGEADRQGLSDEVTLVSVSRCKGLEFDAVVLVEPAAVEREGGARLLYVALTRAMRALTVVHAAALPEVMGVGWGMPLGSAAR